MYKLCFYVPMESSETVKNAVFEAGAGQLGNYSNCAWETSGNGQFKPLAGSNPHIGHVDELEIVPEMKVEMLCSDECIEAAVNKLKQAHPYEEPAYDVVKLEKF